MKKIRIIYCLLTFIISFETTLLIISKNKPYNNQNNEVKIEETEILEENDKCIEDIIISADVNYGELKNKIVNYINDDINNIGIAFYDLKNDEGFEINADIQFFPASVSKLYSIIILYDYNYKNKININNVYYYTGSDYEAGTGILQTMDLSRGYSLLSLSDYAIKYSDNIAYRMINRIIGKNNIKEYYENIIGHKTTDNTFYVSANDAKKMLMKVYYNIDNNYLYDRLIDNMKNTIFPDRLAAHLPKEIVAHKIGNYGSYVHDVGIIYDDTPYILCILTKSVNNSYEKIADVSKIIYDYLSE